LSVEYKVLFHGIYTLVLKVVKYKEPKKLKRSTFKLDDNIDKHNDCICGNQEGAPPMREDIAVVRNKYECGGKKEEQPEGADE
jgi:hypothetical protein